MIVTCVGCSWLHVWCWAKFGGRGGLSPWCFKVAPPSRSLRLRGSGGSYPVPAARGKRRGPQGEPGLDHGGARPRATPIGSDAAAGPDHPATGVQSPGQGTRSPATLPGATPSPAPTAAPARPVAGRAPNAFTLISGALPHLVLHCRVSLFFRDPFCSPIPVPPARVVGHGRRVIPVREGGLPSDCCGALVLGGALPGAGFPLSDLRQGPNEQS